jgi:hypothetical protein
VKTVGMILYELLLLEEKKCYLSFIVVQSEELSFTVIGFTSAVKESLLVERKTTSNYSFMDTKKADYN